MSFRFTRPGLRLARLCAAALLLAGCRDGTGASPVPTLSSLDPASVLQGSAGFTLTVTGSGFAKDAQVRWNGVGRPTTYVSATRLTATIPAADLEQPAVVPVSVFNPAPGGGSSATLSLQVRVRINPEPVVASLSPDVVLAGQGGTVRVAGTGFVPTSQVRIGVLAPPTTYVSETELRFVLAPEQVPAAGEAQVHVFNAAPGGGISAPQPLHVHNPAPTLSAATPATALAGQDSLVVRVAGSGFVAATQVRVAGTARPTRLLSPTEVEATLPSDDLGAAGTLALDVFNPAPGGGASGGASISLTAPAPVLTLLPAEGASAGRGGFDLRVHGTGFLRSSVVRWNGADRATRYLGNTRLEITVSAADVAAAGAAAITVHTPGGGTSSAAQLTVRGVPAATRTSLRTLVVPAVDMVYDPHSARLYASLGAEGTRINRILAIDPATGVVVDSVMLAGDPGSLAVSDDGSTLWVEINATHEIRRVALPSLTPGTSFSTDGHFAGEIHPLPGRPGTIAVALENPGSSPRYRGVAVYDDGVRRTLTAEAHIGSGTIAWGENETVLYGADGETSDRGFSTLRVDAAGVTEARLTRGMSFAYMRIRYANGRVYGSSGSVIDAARHERVGAIEGGTTHVGFALLPDARLGRVFYVAGGIFTAYDMNTLQPLGSFSLGGTSGEHPANARLRLVRWAADGLAYRVDNQIFIFRTPLAAP